MARKVCIVTGTRAEWGLLRLPARHIRETAGLEPQIVATAAHLSPAFGHTVDEIEAAGFTVDARVPMLEAGDDAAAITRALGRGVMGFADAFAALKPDVVMILGDRFEMLGVAQAALIARIPVAHLCGGDLTEGAFDDAIRHAITKMSHIHFVTNAAAAKRVRQLGENPDHIHLVGSPGIDAILELPRMSRAELFAELGADQGGDLGADVGLPPRRRLITATFHPPTLDEISAERQMQVFLDALHALGPEVAIILTGSNADTDGRALSEMAQNFAAAHDNAVFATSLGQKRYFSALAHSDAVVGNSSSGLYEAPSFKVPTVNVGSRQDGRLRASSVIDCPVEAAAITDAIEQAFAMDCSKAINPYGNGDASRRIAEVLAKLDAPQALIKKRFVDLP